MTATVSAYAAYAALNNQLEQDRRAQAEQVVLVEYTPFIEDAAGEVPRIQNFSRLPIRGLSLSVAHQAFVDESDEPIAVYAADYHIGSLEPCEQVILTGSLRLTERRLDEQMAGRLDDHMTVREVIRYIDAAGNTWFRHQYEAPRGEDDRYLFHGESFAGTTVTDVRLPVVREQIRDCNPA